MFVSPPPPTKKKTVWPRVRHTPLIYISYDTIRKHKGSRLATTRKKSTHKKQHRIQEIVIRGVERTARKQTIKQTHPLTHPSIHPPTHPFDWHPQRHAPRGAPLPRYPKPRCLSYIRTLTTCNKKYGTGLFYVPVFVSNRGEALPYSTPLHTRRSVRKLAGYSVKSPPPPYHYAFAIPLKPNTSLPFQLDKKACDGNDGYINT